MRKLLQAPCLRAASGAAMVLLCSATLAQPASHREQSTAVERVFPPLQHLLLAGAVVEEPRTPAGTTHAPPPPAHEPPGLHEVPPPPPGEPPPYEDGIPPPPPGEPPPFEAAPQSPPHGTQPGDTTGHGQNGLLDKLGTPTNAPGATPTGAPGEPTKPTRAVPQPKATGAPGEQPPEPTGAVPQLKATEAPGEPPKPPRAVPELKPRPKDNPVISAGYDPKKAKAPNPSQRVYPAAIVKPPGWDVAKAKLLKGKLNGAVLDQVESGGRLIGGGLNSTVFENNDQSGVLKNETRVWKFVPVPDTPPGGLPGWIAMEATVTDQIGGRQILTDIKNLRSESPFSVARRYGSPDLVSVEDQSSQPPTSRLFARFDEQSISKKVMCTDPSNTALFNQEVAVSNALDRINARPVRPRIGGRGLSIDEEATVNKVIRDLNDFGIVWTDHKLRNFDIFEDRASPTGYTMQFFDFDSFRPVKGEDPEARAKTARELQKIFDASKDVAELHRFFNYKYGGGENLPFDYTAFGTDLSYTYSVGDNLETGRERSDYLAMDQMNREEFDKQYQKLVKGVAAKRKP